MSRCLRDRTLWKLSEGEGTPVERAHVEACPVCARRYQRLGRDLDVLRQVLHEAPPLQAVPQRTRGLRVRWLTVAAVLALALAWAGGSLEVWWQRLPPVPVEAHSEAVNYLQAALDGDWPCNGQEPFFHLDCDQAAVPELVEGP